MIDCTSVFIQLAEKNKGNKKFTKDIIYHGKKKSPFIGSAEDILKRILSLQKILIENSKSFLHSSHLKIDQKEGELFDKEALEIIKRCKDELDTLREVLEMSQKKYSESILAHMRTILSILQDKLLHVNDLFKQQRVTRFEKSASSSGYLRLPALKGVSPIARSRYLNKSTEDFTQSPSLQSNLKSSISLMDISDKDRDREEQQQEINNSMENMTPTEKQLLEEENTLIYQQMLETNQALEIEKQMIEISNLTTQAAFHVAEQAELIDHTFVTAVQVKSNIDGAVKQLVKAQERGVGFRHFVLLFFIILGLSLLFLHYITD